MIKQLADAAPKRLASRCCVPSRCCAPWLRISNQGVSKQPVCPLQLDKTADHYHRYIVWPTQPSNIAAARLAAACSAGVAASACMASKLTMCSYRARVKVMANEEGSLREQTTHGKVRVSNAAKGAKDVHAGKRGVNAAVSELAGNQPAQGCLHRATANRLRERNPGQYGHRWLSQWHQTY